MKKILSAVLALTLFAGLYGCDGSSGTSSKNSSSKLISSSQKKIESTKKTTITQSQAISIAKNHIESKLANGEVIGGNKKAASYRTVLFGDISCEYNSTSGSYSVSCKGTCWGKDNYGMTLDKYKFDVSVFVTGDRGSASSSSITLKKA